LDISRIGNCLAAITTGELAYYSVEYLYIGDYLYTQNWGRLIKGHVFSLDLN